MGTRGLLGFIVKGVRKGTFNQYDSYPSGLGDAIIKFILAHTDEELEEMRLKIEQIEWVHEDQVQPLHDEDRRHLHMPSMERGDGRRWVDPDTLLQSVKDANPEIAAQLDDKEITMRYLPASPAFRPAFVQETLQWIPELDEVIEGGQQLQLLDRIWDGRQKHIIDSTVFAKGLCCEYTYWIDFENKIIEATGVIEDTLIIPFKDLRMGIFSEKNAEYWEGVEKAEAEEKRQLQLKDAEARMAALDLSKREDSKKAQEHEGSDDEGSVGTVKGN